MCDDYDLSKHKLVKMAKKPFLRGLWPPTASTTVERPLENTGRGGGRGLLLEFSVFLSDEYRSGNHFRLWWISVGQSPSHP